MLRLIEEKACKTQAEVRERNGRLLYEEYQSLHSYTVLYEEMHLL